ncbi:BRO family protein [Selenomonas sp. AE3005]|uniref:BRO-N domain-containing protein n=1 Tax=Selenomonas sp. AE3005 TaxID=1485543 RepID=UPI0025F36D61|nr:BRO family protein [Selenomonas sp. AE3005]
MNNDIQIFNNPEFGAVRTMTIDKEPWFVGKDVAEILGYAKPLNALASYVDTDDSLKQGLIDSLGRKQDTIIINESGLYSLIFSSKLPSAKAFKHWVTSEVLPQIRKTGRYQTPKLSPNPHYRTRMIKTAVKDLSETADVIAELFGVKKGMATAAAMKMVGSA